jgi:hypothetical protein
MAKILTGSIDLTKLKSAKHTTEKGTECLLIPIEQDGLFASDKGSVYLNLNIFDADEEDKYGNTANVSINQSKEQRESKEPKTYLGNLKTVWSGSGGAKSSPKASPKEDGDTPF